MAQEIADSTLLDTWASSGLIVKPDISKIIEGWQLGEQPPHEYMNWLQNTFGSKLNHILKNGVVKWNDETEYLSGGSVQHNGNIWLSKITNTNSEPTDVSANWKRIITVESLTTILGGYVKNTGDQDIDDVKTFLKSPIVPTPTTGTQAVNKDYADLKVALASFTGANQMLGRNGYQKLPGGVIIQWGQVTNNLSLGGGSNTIVFPIAFPNECLSIAKMNETSSGGSYGTTDASFVKETLTASGVAWIGYLSDNSISIALGQVGISYIAIGY